MKRIFNGKYKITQTYHDRHKGLDVVGLSDKNVRSPIDGVVRSSTLITDHGNLTWEWGNYVRVDDADGNKLYFCHLAARFVKVGQKVKVGDPLGIMGNTGKSFGAHCHFEVRTQANLHKNPADYLGVPNEKTTYEWIKTKSGWIKEKGDWYYLNPNGSMRIGWLKLDGRWYWFGVDGKAAKGFQTIDGKRYYFAEKWIEGVKECQLIVTDENGAIL